jgi:hypothetical protein
MKVVFSIEPAALYRDIIAAPYENIDILQLECLFINKIILELSVYFVNLLQGIKI